MTQDGCGKFNIDCCRRLGDRVGNNYRFFSSVLLNNFKNNLFEKNVVLGA